MPIINWKVVPHTEQRSEAGSPADDYWTDDSGIEQYRTSQMSCPEYDWLSFLHGFVENSLRKFAGVRLKDIDTFDETYEKCRKNGLLAAPCGCPIQDDPGMDKHAPYYLQHRMADIIERGAAFALGVDWLAYDRETMDLDEK